MAPTRKSTTATVSPEQSAILAQIRKKAAGNYEKAKTVQAKAGGRSLPTKLVNAVGQMTQLKLDTDKNGNAFAYLYGNCVETGQGETEYAGLHAGKMYPLSEQVYDNFSRSFEQNFEAFLTDLKLLGRWTQEIEEADEATFFTKVLPAIIADIDANKPYYLFNTSKREKQDGSVNIFIQGVPADDYEPPQGSRQVNQHESKGYVPASTPAPSKAPSPQKSKAPPKGPACPWTVGQEVIADFDGTPYEGTISSVDAKAKTVQLTFDGSEDLYEAGFDALTAKAPPAPAPKAPPKAKAPTRGKPALGVGTPVKTVNDPFQDGNEYLGVIEADRGGNWLVKWDDDGSVVEIEKESIAAR